MKTHERAATHETIRSVATWVAVLAMLVLVLFALADGDLNRIWPAGHADERGDTNLLIAATDADREFLARMEARSQLAQALMDGKVTLLEAAAACNDLDGRSPGFDAQRFHARAVGDTDEERYCRLMISGVEAIIATKPDVDREIVARLHRELAQSMKEGTLLFPAQK